MRLLSVIHGPVYGGGHSQLVRLRRPLEALGCETVALVPSESGNAFGRLREAGVDVLSIPLHRLRATPNPGTHGRFLAAFRSEVRAIRGLIRERAIDVVQAHGDTNPHAALAAHKEGVAVVWQLYDTRTPPPLRRLTMPVVTRLSDVITTWGDELARVHPGATGLGERQITVFPPVDTAEFSSEPWKVTEARASLAVPDGSVVIGTVGNLNPSKGHEYLIRAALVIRERRRDAAVRIMGAHSPAHAEYEAALRAEVSEHGLDVDGMLEITDPGSDVPRLMPALDVFVLTSVPRSEGVPTVILEAMACGIPVVASDVGAVSEIVENGVTGFVVPARSPEATAAAVLRLLDDAGTRRAMGQQARQRALERYDLRSLAAIHHGAYQLAIEHRARRR